MLGDCQYWTLQNAVHAAVERAMQVTQNGQRQMSEIELEIRFGMTATPKGTTYALPQDYVACSTTATLRHEFHSCVGEPGFYRTADWFLTKLPGVCYSVSPLEKTFVTRSENDVRYVQASDGTMSAVYKLRDSNFAHGGVADFRPAKSGTHAIRVALSYEEPLMIDSALRFNFEEARASIRTRERRSIRLYDTSTLAQGPTYWASEGRLASIIAKDAHAFDALPCNVWRIDLTRVDDGRMYQVELELEFERAVRELRAEFDSSWPSIAEGPESLGLRPKRQHVHVKQRIASMLGECLMRVEYALTGAAPVTWCRTL